MKRMNPKKCPHSTWIPDEAPDYRCVECGVIGRKWIPKPWQRTYGTSRGIPVGSIVPLTKKQKEQSVYNHRIAQDAVKEIDEGIRYPEYDQKTTAGVDDVVNKKRRPT